MKVVWILALTVVAVFACAPRAAAPSATLTASPTPTQSSSPTPVPSVAVIPSGWTSLDLSSDGFTLAIPPSWRSLTMDPHTLDGAYKALVEQYPSFGQTASAEQFQQLMAQGLKVTAIDFGDGGGMTQLTVVQQPLPVEMSLDYYTQAYASAAEVKHGLKVTVGETQLAGRDARIVSYDLPMQVGSEQMMMRASNYLLIHAKRIYLLGFVTSDGHAEQTRSTIAEIASTFSLRP